MSGYLLVSIEQLFQFAINVNKILRNVCFIPSSTLTVLKINISYVYSERLKGDLPQMFNLDLIMAHTQILIFARYAQ